MPGFGRVVLGLGSLRISPPSLTPLMKATTYSKTIKLIVCNSTQAFTSSPMRKVEYITTTGAGMAYINFIVQYYLSLIHI